MKVHILFYCGTTVLVQAIYNYEPSSGCSSRGGSSDSGSSLGESESLLGPPRITISATKRNRDSIHTRNWKVNSFPSSPSPLFRPQLPPSTKLLVILKAGESLVASFLVVYEFRKYFWFSLVIVCRFLVIVSITKTLKPLTKMYLVIVISENRPFSVLV